MTTPLDDLRLAKTLNTPNLRRVDAHKASAKFCVASTISGRVRTNLGASRPWHGFEVLFNLSHFDLFFLLLCALRRCADTPSHHVDCQTSDSAVGLICACVRWRGSPAPFGDHGDRSAVTVASSGAPVRGPTRCDRCGAPRGSRGYCAHLLVLSRDWAPYSNPPRVAHCTLLSTLASKWMRCARCVARHSGPRVSTGSSSNLRGCLPDR